MPGTSRCPGRRARSSSVIRGAGGAVAAFTVVDARPPRTFSFRWTHPADEVARSRATLLFVTFDLTPSGPGTLLRMTETGFREMGWGSSRTLGQQYREHVTGWDFYLPRVGTLRGRPCEVRLMTTAVADSVDDDLWSAIGDPTRRRMLDLLLVDGGGTATTLGQQCPVTRQAVAKHLAVLDRIGLVRVRPEGREKRYRVDDEQLARAVAQLASVGSAWDVRYNGSSASPSRLRATKTNDNQGEWEMVDILHRVGVKDTTPERGHDALTTVEGLAAWWTEDTRGSGEVGVLSAVSRTVVSTWRSSNCGRSSGWCGG